MSEQPVWAPLSPDDIEKVDQIANKIHVGLPERRDVFVEKIRLFRPGCSKLILDSDIVGYGISHPWRLYSIPPLDQFLGSIPENSDCVYIHDVAVLPNARGYNASARYIEIVRSVAVGLSIRKLACVSVYGTDVLWSRYGFRYKTDDRLLQKLQTYGNTAKYMVADV